MPILRRTTSPLGLSIQGDIQSFIEDNAKAIEPDTDDPDPLKTASDALGHAIAYGIAKGLSSPSMQSAFSAGICPPAGGPVGSLIFNVLKPSSTEV